MTLRTALVTIIGGLCIAVAASACTQTESCDDCADVDVRIPWTAPETATYRLELDGKARGTTTLSIERDGDGYKLTQRTTDEEGNSDEATVTVDSALKPRTNAHVVTDQDERRQSSATYEDGVEDCDAKHAVQIEQLVFKPADESTPDSSRKSPLCLPEHSYDNDSSLFLWRSVPFEEGYHVRYHTVLSNRRDTQIVEVNVREKVDKTPLGDGEAWLVELFANQITQRAWFSTDADHKMLAYQNGDYLFLLEE